MQRFFDLFLSVIALIALSPIFITIVIALRISGEGEVFFTQIRVGLDGKPFQLIKFVTMLKASPNMDNGTVTVKGDARILPLGHFLRNSKLNELPQLLNIIKGDMSLIGPRPQTQRCFDVFLPASKAAIILVRPGLSGIGSIIFRAEESLLDEKSDPVQFYDDVIAPYKGSLEEWYVLNQGILTYFMLMILTVWVVLFPKSRLAWHIFDSLPSPPNELMAGLNYRRHH
jgi:lipopolysaccharide/colanic/teichoic acid biosynthesis glycosyltransferase